MAGLAAARGVRACTSPPRDTWPVGGRQTGGQRRRGGWKGRWRQDLPSITPKTPPIRRPAAPARTPPHPLPMHAGRCPQPRPPEARLLRIPGLPHRSFPPPVRTWSWLPGSMRVGCRQPASRAITSFRGSTGSAPRVCQKSPGSGWVWVWGWGWGWVKNEVVGQSGTAVGGCMMLGDGWQGGRLQSAANKERRKDARRRQPPPPPPPPLLRPPSSTHPRRGCLRHVLPPPRAPAPRPPCRCPGSCGTRAGPKRRASAAAAPPAPTARRAARAPGGRAAPQGPLPARLLCLACRHCRRHRQPSCCSSCAPSQLLPPLARLCCRRRRRRCGLLARTKAADAAGLDVLCLTCAAALAPVRRWRLAD